MANTTNFGWETPDDTDLVKDGAAAMRTLGSAIDTSMMDLKGGTTDQVLAKNSNTDMDFKWVTTDDTNAIQNAIVDAKGDLIAASAADTPARLAVGSNGDTLVANSAASVGLSYQPNFAAGKNKIINGDFGIWQRGTTFTSIAADAFSADRWFVSFDGTGVRTVSRQTFTPGTAPVSGYEGSFFARIDQTTAGSGASANRFASKLEDVRTLAGQSTTISFWAKAAANTTMPSLTIAQSFGSGGSSSVLTTVTSSIAVTTSWTRFSYTFTMPSVSGKTIGTSSFTQFTFDLPLNATFTIDLWGVQLEAGSVATAFQTATGTIQGETALCQRYYYRLTSDATNGLLASNGLAFSTTALLGYVPFPSTMRIVPTAVDTSAMSGFAWDRGNTGSGNTPSSISLDTTTNKQIGVYQINTSSLTANVPYRIYGNSSSTAYVGFTAEL